ncbi:hypothetical protein JW890_01210 [candidate division WOR-3 bacterium]|nr:hypothetical protein [candidate division WOR-3 bacterium]
MNLFSKPDFLKKKYPGFDWGERTSVRRKLDLGYTKLSGVGLYEDWLLLKKFGMPENPSNARSMKFSYYSSGFEFDVENGKITDIFVTWKDFYSPFSAFSGETLDKGKPTGINPKTKEDDFINIFPDVYWRDEDDDEIILFYEFKDFEWQVEFDKSREIKAFIAGGKPTLLSDPEVRKMYKITKDFPF